MTNDLEQLRKQKEILETQVEISNLERIINATGLAVREVQEDWTNLVDRNEYLNDVPGFFSDAMPDYRISSYRDRSRGQFYPFWETEVQHSEIRGIARHIRTRYETGINAAENLINYTVGTGLSYTWVSKTKETKVPDGLLLEAQAALDEFMIASNWTGDLEIELFDRLIRDGEFFVWVRDDRSRPYVTVIEPDCIVEPAATRSIEDYIDQPGLLWSFGCASVPMDPSQIVGYYFTLFSGPQDWEWIDSADMVHAKRNVDRAIKRGMSDYYSCFQTIEKSAKLLTNVVDSATIQSCIAYIRKHAQGTSIPMTTLLQTQGAAVVNLSKVNGQREEINVKKFRPGMVVDTTSDYTYGPMGQSSAPTFIEIINAGMRSVGSRWQMPEYMISADASNANYASTLVSGSPFYRATERRQSQIISDYRRVIHRVMESYIRRGRFQHWGIRKLSDLLLFISLNIEAIKPVIEDRAGNHAINKDLFDKGILSPQTWAERENLDFDAEQSKKKAIADQQQDASFFESVKTVRSHQKKIIEQVISKAGRGRQAIRDLIWGNYPQVQEAKDGDGDGLVNDGTPDERPAEGKSSKKKVNPKVLAWAEKKFKDKKKARAFAEWFGDSKIVDENGEPLELFHGTTADFDQFDQAMSNPESDLGSGFYFTTSKDDVGNNYAGVGPDLQSKIELEAERIAADTDREYDDPDVVAEARAKFMQHEGATKKVFLSIKNPAVIGGKKETFLDFEEEMDDDGEYTGEVRGKLHDFTSSLRDTASRYSDGDVDEAISTIYERAMGNGGLKMSEVHDILKSSEQFSYYTDDAGKMVSNEIFRQSLEEAGYDGIIDNTVNVKFGSERRVGKAMTGMSRGDRHVIAFSPNQIKSATGNRGTFDPKSPKITESADPRDGDGDGVINDGTADERAVDAAGLSEKQLEQMRVYAFKHAEKIGVPYLGMDFERSNTPTMGHVGFAKNINTGRQIPYGKIKIKIGPNSTTAEVKEVIKHELQHVKQGQDDDFYIAKDESGTDSFFWKGEKFITLGDYKKTILDPMSQRTSREVYDAAYKIYIRLPWEVDANKAGNPGKLSKKKRAVSEVFLASHLLRANDNA